MADFQNQVEDLVGTIYSSDTNALTQWLKDGVIDVTNRVLKSDPRKIEGFIRASSEITANDTLDLNGAIVISVVREGGTNNYWRNCSKILPHQQYDVVDENSLYFATDYNPSYMISNDGQINVFPVPINNGTDAFKVYYVNNAPVDKSGASLIHTHSDIGYFLDDKVYLVVIYAAMRALQRKIADSIISVTAVPPDAPIITAATVSLSGVAPTYSASLTSFTSSWSGNALDNDPGAPSFVAVAPEAPTIDDFSVDVAADFSSITAISEIVTNSQFDIDDWQTNFDLDDFDKIKETITMHTLQLKEAKDVFDTQIELAKEKVDSLIEKAKHEDLSEAETKLSKYQAELTEYQQEVTKESTQYQFDLDRYKSEITVASQTWSKEQTDVLQNALNEFNKENAIYQAQLQADIQDAQLESAEEAAKIQKYSAELQQYQAEVSAEVQASQLEIQQYQVKYTWLKQQYDEGFIPIRRQQPQRQEQA